jgi:hypothetical protein
MGYHTEIPSELLVRIRAILAEIFAGDLERSFSRMDGVIAKLRAGRWRVCWMN